MLVKLATIMAVTSTTVAVERLRDYVPRNKQEAAYPREQEAEPL